MPLKIFRNSSGITTQKILEAINSDGGVKAHIIEDKDSLKIIISESRYWGLLQEAMKLESDRQSRYKDYEEMDDDAIISSALELTVDDATQYSQEANATVWVEAGYKYKAEIDQLFNQIDFENKVWGWVYNIAKYGDFIPILTVKQGEGIVHINDNVYPGDIYRVDIEGKLSGFIKRSSSFSKVETLNPWEAVHFINNFRPNFESSKIEIEEKDDSGATVKVKKEITSMYGTSMMQNTRRVHKILNLLEVSLALARLARSAQVRMFYVNTTGMTPDERKTLMKDLKDEYKKKKSIDIDKNWFEQQYSPLGNTDEMFVPYTGERGDMRAESVGGDVNVRDIVDIEYMRNKEFASMRVPKQYLGFEETVPGGLGGNSTLTRLDIRYARMVKKIHRALIEGLYRMIQIHLSFKFKTSISVDDLQLSYVPVSSAEEDTRLEYIERRVAIATSLTAFIGELPGALDAKYLIKYVFKHIIRMPELNTEELVVGSVSKETPEVETLIAKLELLSEAKCEKGDILKVLEEFKSDVRKTLNESKRKNSPRNKDLTAPTQYGGKNVQRKFKWET